LWPLYGQTSGFALRAVAILVGRDFAQVVVMTDLLKWTLIFFVLALIAGLFGFGGVAGAATGIAQILFFGFIVFAVVTLVLNLMNKATK
jgi:uncharacterized membrane protein YtjA (UPF0391 family)